MRNWLKKASALLVGCLLATLSTGQERSVTIPANSKFALQVDLTAIKNTKLGAMLFDLAKQKAVKELAKEGSDTTGLAKIQEMIGFDPFEEVQSLTISSCEYDHPEKSMLAIVQLQQTAGNLEGMALGLPEYAATEYHQHHIHSAAPDKHLRVFGAIHGNGNQSRTLIVTPDQPTLHTVLDNLDGPSSDKQGINIALGNTAARLIGLQVFDIPQDKIGKGPQANVAKIVKKFMLDAQGVGEDITLTANMSTETEKQAEQLQQMAQGLVAMLDFAQSMDSEDSDIRKLREMLVGVETIRAGTEVKLSLTIKAEKIAQAIARELEIDLSVDTKQLEERQRLERVKQELEAKLEATKQELSKIK